MKKIFIIILFSVIFINNKSYATTSNNNKNYSLTQIKKHKKYKKNRKHKIHNKKNLKKNYNIADSTINQLLPKESQNNNIKESNIINSVTSESIQHNFSKLNNDKIFKKIKLHAYSAMVINSNTGDVIINKNSTITLPIASITKLMTAMVVLDAKVNMDDYVNITSEDVDTLKNTYSRLKVGMSLTRNDLLLLALMSSENRAAHALARTTFKGGISTFINKMNNKALELKMYNTKFYDPTGLNDKNISTAFDLVKMVQKAYEYNEIRIATTTKNANVMLSPKYIHKYVNTDALIRAKNSKINIKVSKTGFINEAGHCLVLYTIIENKPIIMVFLNSTGKSGRLLDALTVKSYIENNNNI
jgi:D-alanyl-D-alanine endopeptidase (penicillin-binding protein 7)